MSGAVEHAAVKAVVPVVDLSPIDRALDSDDEGALARAVKSFRAADIGRDLSRRSVAQGRRLILASDEREAAQALQSAHPTVAARVIQSCDVGRSARILSFLPVEKQTAILSLVDPEDRSRLESALDADDRRDVSRLMAYPPSAVGRHATPKIWRVPSTATVGDALQALRADDADIEVAQNCYVVVENQKPVGVVPLRKLVTTDPSAPIAKVMSTDVIALSEETEVGDAAEIIRTHNFLSLPVVDKQGALVGAVRLNDLFDVTLSRVGTGLLNQGAVEGSVAAQAPYFQLGLFRAVRSRLTWLILLFVAETATGTVLRHFEDELAKVVALSFFIPLLIGTGGNAGSQTVSTVIRALALGEVRTRDVMRVVFKEMTTGLLLGLLLGAIAFGRALLWGVTYDLAACVGLTVLVVCTWANTVGAAIPVAAQAVKIDPTVVSAPLITTLVDASGLFIYLTIAHVLVAQLHGG
jgi:magnesium transporter